MESKNRFVAVKRTALDGKVWWVVFDNKHNKVSTLTCFGRYRRKKACEWHIGRVLSDKSMESFIK